MNSKEQAADTYPCVIDLRAFAERRGGPGAGSVRDDFLTARRYVGLPEGLTSVGIVELDASEGRVDAMPRDEFVVAMEGELRISGPVDFVLRTGESAVLPKNSAFSWIAEAPAVLAFINQESDGSDRRQPVKID